MSLPGLSPEELKSAELAALPTRPFEAILEHKLEESIAGLEAVVTDNDATAGQRNRAIARVGIYSVGLQELAGDTEIDTSGVLWQKLAAQKIEKYREENPTSSEELMKAPFFDRSPATKRELNRLVFSGMIEGEDKLTDREMAIRIAQEDFDQVFEISGRYI